MGNVGQVEQVFTERRLPLRGLSPPDPGTVHLWLVDLAAMGSPLQPDETIDPAHFPVRQQRTLRRFYLRLLLGAYLDLPGKDVHISRADRGKPVLDPAHHDGGLAFSLAASSGHCLVGVTTGTVVGVDLEPRGRRTGKPLSLARRYFSPDELLSLQEQEPERLDEAFLHTWACKEAVVKAGGSGIANALCRFTVCTHPGEVAAVLAMDDDEPQAWQLRSFAIPGGLLGAVSVRHSQLETCCFRLAPP